MSFGRRRASAVGGLVGFDMAHAIGNIELELHEWNVDFAVWCSYKYLCGGPGALGDCFVHARHGIRSDLHQYAGWWGTSANARFGFDADAEFVPRTGVEGWRISNPSVFATAPLLAALNIIERVGPDGETSKVDRAHRMPFGCSFNRSSLRFGSRLPALVESRVGCRPRRRCGFRASFRGSHLRPDVIRLSPAPLYNSWVEASRAARVLERLFN